MEMDLYTVRIGLASQLIAREGLLTVVAGFFAYFIIVDYPETAKFLTEDEKAWTIWVRSSDQGKYGEADHVTFK
jgi:hypothetical protein